MKIQCVFNEKKLNTCSSPVGKFGDQAEELVTLRYFQDRVTFVDFSAVIEEIGIEHNYQFSDEAVELYAEFKAEKMVDFKME